MHVRLLWVEAKVLAHQPLHLLQSLLERPAFVLHLADSLSQRFILRDDSLKADECLLVCPVLVFNK